jgi:transcriptional regulator GlxA family with amidase domain
LRDRARLSADLALLRVLHPYRNDPEGRRLASHVVKDLLLLPALESLERPASSISDPLVAEACRRLETEFSGDVSLGRLAAELGLRPVQLTRRFAAVLGRTPLEHLTLLRLARARGLLLETDLPLEAVARRCGYSSGFYLSRLFSAREGISPSEFRRQRRV